MTFHEALDLPWIEALFPRDEMVSAVIPEAEAVQYEGNPAVIVLSIGCGKACAMIPSYRLDEVSTYVKVCQRFLQICAEDGDDAGAAITADCLQRALELG